MTTPAKATILSDELLGRASRLHDAAFADPAVKVKPSFAQSVAAAQADDAAARKAAADAAEKAAEADAQRVATEKAAADAAEAAAAVESGEHANTNTNA